MKTYKIIFWILLVLTALALVLFAALADIDTAGAQEAQPDDVACWHGCPHRTAQIWLPVVMQRLPMWYDRDDGQSVK